MKNMVLMVFVIFLFACPSPNYVPTEFQYSEYQCPEPIGLIVRENCRENVIKYQAEDINVGVKGSVTSIATVDGTYKDETKVLQEASEFIQFLKDQQVSLCNDYNTCKLTTAEYKERKDRTNKAFTTVYALTKQIKVESLDPEIKKDIMKKILSAIDDYNKPLPRTEEKTISKPKFKAAPAKVRDNQNSSSIPSHNIQSPNIETDNPYKKSPDKESSSQDVSSEQLEEAQKQMIKMQQKAFEMQKKAIELQKNFDANPDEGGEEY